ncbi:uncharacterized protein LOC135498338 [Lineus longissimus]|uniref:uncharacterized protein LOC135498338 n=1 Tax=Lineus longissimus TaxID=88925 RepID=UPI00315D4EC3
MFEENEKGSSNRTMAYTHITSPLRFKQTIEHEPSSSLPRIPKMELVRQETGFVNDAIKTVISYRAKKIPIIPVYDALSDRECKGYFLSPVVQGVLTRTMSQDDIILRDPKKSINKLSVRRRCVESPGTAEKAKREKAFVNDAIITERRRTKYKDIIPKYDAANDADSRHYFKRRDVKDLLSVTCSLEKNRTNRWWHLSDPNDEQLMRERTFINDAIQANNRKTRYKGLIPPYNAMNDKYARSFVQKELPKMTGDKKQT